MNQGLLPCTRASSLSTVQGRPRLGTWQAQRAVLIVAQAAGLGVDATPSAP